ncbi:alpha/beta fold hydrolase [Streptosporangium saharense]|uniref:alpha/beta fold hydrolase n=1 Tax=Streptosporangium saharense TaxID=1706840 RepID=UPI0036C89895
MTGPTLVLVHGAWHGARSWDPLLPFLEEAGLRTLAVQLPGVGRAPGRHDLAGHSAFLRAELESLTGPLVVCGHSYGGAVVTQAVSGLASGLDSGPGDGLGGRVRRLVYVAAFMLEVGESCVDAAVPAPVPPEPHLTSVAEGDYLTVSEEAATHMFYGDCDPALARAAVASLTPEHLMTVGSPVTGAAWHTIPSTYVVCENDQALSPVAQARMAERATRTLSLDSSHSPMLSRPRELAAILAEAAGNGG